MKNDVDPLGWRLCTKVTESRVYQEFVNCTKERKSVDGVFRTIRLIGPREGRYLRVDRYDE